MPNLVALCESNEKKEFQKAETRSWDKKFLLFWLGHSAARVPSWNVIQGRRK